MEKKIRKNLLIFVFSGLLFFAFTMPFRKILSVFTVSEVRPAAVLNPFLGICFGLPSALGIMVANLIADAVSGYPLAVLLEGLVPQFLYTYVPYLMWKKLTAGEDHIHRLDCAGRVLKFALVVLVSALLAGVGVGLIVHGNFGAPFLSCAFFVLLNNFDIGLLLGCPLMILSNQIISRRSGTDRTVTDNEKIILVTAALEIVGLAVLIPTAYAGGQTAGLYDIWNTIYLYAVVMLNAMMLISLFFMWAYQQKKD